jgi:hypothetical protein
VRRIFLGCLIYFAGLLYSYDYCHSPSGEEPLLTLHGFRTGFALPVS